MNLSFVLSRAFLELQIETSKTPTLSKTSLLILKSSISVLFTVNKDSIIDRNQSDANVNVCSSLYANHWSSIQFLDSQTSIAFIYVVVDQPLVKMPNHPSFNFWKRFGFQFLLSKIQPIPNQQDDFQTKWYQLNSCKKATWKLIQPKRMLPWAKIK